MKLQITVFLFLSCLFINAQSGFYSKGFEVTKSDLETNIYEKDSTANALIIYETGKSFVDRESFNLVTEIKKKLKI